MARFTDDNGVTWDIKTTSTKIDNAPAVGVFFAGVADNSSADYSGNEFPLADEDTFPAGTKITWPALGNPILRGPGDGVDAIKLFAARVKSGAIDKILKRRKGAGGGAGAVLLGLGILYLISES